MRNFEQSKCPNPDCGEIILMPDINFSVGDERAKVRNGCCIWCRELLIFNLSLKDPATVELLGKVCRVSAPLPHVTGVVPVTDIAVRTSTDRIEARVGVAIMGSTNFESSIGANPFDFNFHDNYCFGKGDTLEKAIENLIKDMEAMGKFI